MQQEVTYYTVCGEPSPFVWACQILLLFDGPHFSEVKEVSQVRQGNDLPNPGHSPAVPKIEQSLSVDSKQGQPQSSHLYLGQEALTTGSQAWIGCRSGCRACSYSWGSSTRSSSKTTLLGHWEIIRKQYNKLAACNKMIIVQRSQENIISMHSFECWTKRVII